MAGLESVLAAILAEARAQVAAGEPHMAGLEARIATAVRHARSAGDDAAVVDKLEAAARRRLSGIMSVGRARARLAREPAPQQRPRTQPGRPPALRTRPTITGTLDVRRAEGEGYELVWDAVPAVTEWEVRFSERPGQRSDYAEREMFVLAAAETSRARAGASAGGGGRARRERLHGKAVSYYAHGRSGGVTTRLAVRTRRERSQRSLQDIEAGALTDTQARESSAGRECSRLRAMTASR